MVRLQLWTNLQVTRRRLLFLWLRPLSIFSDGVSRDATMGPLLIEVLEGVKPDGFTKILGGAFIATFFHALLGRRQSQLTEDMPWERLQSTN